MSADREWLIWSFEHRAWWKPAERGYTTDVRNAGRYTYEKALEICVNANLHMRELPNEGMVPLPSLRPNVARQPDPQPMTAEETEIFRHQRNHVAGDAVRESLGMRKFTVGQRVRFRGYQEYPADFPISKGAIGSVVSARHPGGRLWGWPYLVKFDDHRQALGMGVDDLDAVFICPRCDGSKSIWVGRDGVDDALCPDCRGTGVTS